MPGAMSSPAEPPATPSHPVRRSLGWALERLRAVDRLGADMGSWPGDVWATRINRVQILVWTVLSGSVLVRTGHFTYDQAYFYELAVRTAEALRLPGYGPFVSGVQDSPLTPGGMLYAVLSVPFLLVRDPRWGMAWLHLLSAGGMLLFDAALRRLGVQPAMRIATLVLMGWSVAHARATETFWNGDVFVFATPTLLYLTARLVTEASSRWKKVVLFGLVSAVLVQTHLSGAMAISVCLAVWLVQRPESFTVRRLALVVAIVALCYVPYFVSESQVDFINTHWLRSAVPSGERHWTAAMTRSLLAPIAYVSHPEYPVQLWPPFPHTWPGWVIGLSGVGAAVFALLGLFTRFSLKLSSVLVFLGLPVFFWLNGRDYFDHYAQAVVPFCCLWAGAGAGRLLAAGGPWRALTLAYLVAFCGGATALLLTQLREPVLHPVMPWNGMNVAYQVKLVREELARADLPGSGPGDESALTRAVVARRLFGRELWFNVYGMKCRVEIRLTGLGPPQEQPPGTRVLPLAANSVFVCPP